MARDILVATCGCGHTRIEARGAPIIAANCYCDSCRRAGHIFETLPGAPKVVDNDGGTPFILYRKDRVVVTNGRETLREHRIKPDSKTRRIVASCCNAPMFLEFTSGHWLSLYKGRFAPQDQPPVEIRTMTGDRQAGPDFSDGVPSYKTHSVRFMWQLMKAWAAMGFRAPKVDGIKGELAQPSR
ncbi:GFA family protein [Arvimicrobium flavum]|uniref:GFA family protein n=1 Tax=Arvimicrobium flavum TaxID=3393320 RepID=UPI00237C066D|nr:hypothetical protein [Mesorhizobium shangrilense]